MSERLRGEFSKLLSSKKNRRANKNIGENLGPQIKGKLRLVHKQKITPYIQKAKRKETFTPHYYDSLVSPSSLAPFHGQHHRHRAH